MEYEFYLFSKLYDVHIDVDYYYDEMYEDLKKLYAKFLESAYNDPNDNPYENISSFFIDNSKQILSSLDHKIRQLY